MAYFLTPYAIFLCGEDKYHKCDYGELIINGGGSGGVNTVWTTLNITFDNRNG